MKRLLPLALLAAACRAAQPLPAHTAFEGRAARALLICLDGVREDVFYEEVEAGRLGAFAFLLKHGARFEKATTIFPSITFAAQAAAGTGRLPNRNGVPGIRWFDRRAVANRSYAGFGALVLDEDVYPEAKTFFEYAGEGERGYSVVLEPARLAHRVPPINWEDNWRGRFLAKEIRSDSPPHFMGLWMTSVDWPAHEYGGRSREVRARLAAMDRAVGEVLRALDETGLLPETVFGLYSDHGHHAIDRHTDLWDDLRALGMTARRIPLYNARFNLFGYFDVVAWVGGDGYASLYVPAAGVEGPGAGRPDWKARPTGERLRAYPLKGKVVDLPLEVAGMRGVDWAAFRDGETAVVVVAARGEGRITASGSEPSKTRLSYAYEVTRGVDPLGYGALADGRFRTADEWLEATIDSDNADAPVQLFAALEGARAPDMIVAAERRVELVPSPHRSRHGGMSREEMRVPVFVAGAGVPPGARIPFGRTVDLLPTMLDAMGRGDAFDGDGRSRMRARPGGGRIRTGE